MATEAPSPKRTAKAGTIFSMSAVFSMNVSQYLALAPTYNIRTEPVANSSHFFVFYFAMKWPALSRASARLNAHLLAMNAP
jgi:hypothetical protein